MRNSTFLFGALLLSFGGVNSYGQSYSLDPTFGTAGKAVITFPTPPLATDAARRLVVQPDGRLLVAGEINKAFGVARLTGAGQADPSFGQAGTVTTAFTVPASLALGATTLSAQATALLVQADGRIVAGGEARTTGPLFKVYARYSAAGVLDDSFSTAGQLITPTSLGGLGGGVTALAQQADGQMISVGYRNGLSFDAVPALDRLTTTGALDNSYVPSYPLVGNETNPVGTRNYKVPFAALLDAEGRLLTAGVHTVNQQNYVGPQGPGLVCYLASGQSDPAFGTNGVAILTKADGGTGVESWRRLLLQADGKIVVAATQRRYVGNQPVSDSVTVARYLANGTLDAAFGRRGIATAAFGSVATDVNEKLVGLGQLPGGELLVGVSTTSTFNLVRLTASGQTRTGELPSIMASPDLLVADMQLQSDGKVVVAGTQTDAAGTKRFTVARLVAATPLASSKAALQVAQIQLFPNPATQQLTLRLPAGLAGSGLLSVQVVNLLGQEVLVWSTIRAVAGEVALPLSAVRPGSYVLRVQGAGFLLTRPFVRAD